MNNEDNTPDDACGRIARPELWTLHLELRPGELDYALWCGAADDSLIYGSVALDCSTGSYLKALESAVYDTPLLLLPYRKVRVLVESDKYLLLPSSEYLDGDGPENAGDADDAENMPANGENVATASAAADCDDSCDVDDYVAEALACAYPDADGDMALCRLPQCGAAIAYYTEPGVQAFLRRTFFGLSLMHELTPLCEYHCRRARQGTVRRLTAHLRPGRMSVCLCAPSGLLMACTYAPRTPGEAAYYLLHIVQSYGLDVMADELQLTGDKTLRDALLPILRKYVNFVMPAIFPPEALRIGHDAVRAPLPLILLALCQRT